MIVRELVARLIELDPELHVVMPSEYADFTDVSKVELDTVVAGNGGLQLADEHEVGCFSVVRLLER